MKRHVASAYTLCPLDSEKNAAVRLCVELAMKLRVREIEELRSCCCQRCIVGPQSNERWDDCDQCQDCRHDRCDENLFLVIVQRGPRRVQVKQVGND